jgi:23S rRNA (guanine745-N1)-methyltransferase
MNRMAPVLACSVRDCGRPLERSDQVWRCALGHSFDVARTGYVNLLQPQDRRSLDAGDAAASVDARARTVAAGPGREIFESFVGRAAALPFADGAAVIDLGCGSGELLGALARVRRVDAIGIDLSTAAVDRAARNFPDLTWVVANADRRLPLLDRSVMLIVSLHARRNPPECARVLGDGGRLLVAVPAHDDLAELREAVQGAAEYRDRGDALVDAHASHFILLDRTVVRHVVETAQAQLLDLLAATYRGFRRRDAERVRGLTRMDVTFASEFFLFAPRA